MNNISFSNLRFSALATGLKIGYLLLLIELSTSATGMSSSLESSPPSLLNDDSSRLSNSSLS